MLRKFNANDAEAGFSAWTSDERVARAVIKFLFNDVNYRKIIAGCDSENIGSARVMEKIGLKRRGVLREYIKRKDGILDDDF